MVDTVQWAQTRRINIMGQEWCGNVSLIILLIEQQENNNAKALQEHRITWLLHA